MCRHVYRVRARVTTRAFTLVELLIVVGIIALLLSLLLPALATARRAAMRTVCQSNMRQIVGAFIMYVNDNGGAFPRPAQEMHPFPEDWVHFQSGRTFADGRVTRYLGDGERAQQVLVCPTDDVSSHRFFYWGAAVPDPGTNTLLRPRPDKYPFSYTVNEFICRIAPAQTLRYTQIRRPSDKIFLVDESSETIDDGCWAWANDLSVGGNVMSNRHARRTEVSKNKLGTTAGRGNVAFIDGHVAYMDRKETYQRKYFDPRF